MRVPRVRIRPWVVIIVVSLTAIGIGWIVKAKMRYLDANLGRYYSYQESAAHEAVLEQSFLKLAVEAEQNAASSEGAESRRWATEAKVARSKAARCAESRRDYKNRAALLERQFWHIGR
jgi:hypothetical protein